MPVVFKIKNKEEFPHDKKQSNYLHCMSEIRRKGQRPTLKVIFCKPHLTRSFTS